MTYRIKKNELNNFSLMQLISKNENGRVMSIAGNASPLS